MKETAINILIVGTGGGVGSIFRYLMSIFIARFNVSGGFPVATFIVNVSGCILIGILIGLSGRLSWMDSNMKLLLITGFCGGYTTFSTFALENIQLIENRQFLTFFLYMAGSIVLGVCGVVVGNMLVK